jgi:two-component system osmolarity sensor histidine kinase EnvZ
LRIIDEFRRGTLCSRTTLTITLVSSTFLLFTLTVLAIFVVVPTAQRSAQELASLVQLSAEALHTVSPTQRQRFTQHLYEAYEIDLAPPPRDLYPRRRHPPFFLLLEQALAQKLGHEVTVLQSDTPGRENHYWVRLDDGERPLHVGFEYSHKWIDPPLIILIIIVVGLLATFVTGMTLARRLTHPLKQLAISSRQLGSGEQIDPLPETGPLELRELVASFNRMSQQIHDLLANRTTLLAGISHDLRTPLTRMELSVEMLDKEAEPSLVAQLQRDLAQMNTLIGLFLEVSRGLQEEKREQVEVAQLLAAISDEFQGSGQCIDYRPGPPGTALVHPLALKRIVTNLLENALRYGKEVALRHRRDEQNGHTVIEVLDRGPGIPAGERQAVFRPFYRLEQSRSSDTGGSGLGLSIVRQLAKANGCRVELLPREGGGTVARLSLAAATA